MQQDIGLIAAFTGGLLSFLSPCVLPLVPSYLSYLAGATLEELSGDDEAAAANRRAVRNRAVITAVLFVLGFSTVFVIMGASATAIGRLVREHLQLLAQIAGVLIIVMGLHFIGIFRLRFLLMEKRVHVDTQRASLIGAYVMGLAFALGWTPCIGPVLASILSIAATEETVGRGAIMLSVYSAGLGVPFVLAAFAINGFLAFMRRFRRHLRLVEILMGVLLVITGVMFLTGTMQVIASWILVTFPWLAEIG